MVPLLTALFQFIQSKMMTLSSPPSGEKNLPTTRLPAEQGGQEKKKKDDFASAFQSQSLYIFPLMIGFFSYQFPIGLSLYWNTFTVFGIIQQYQISGLGGLESLWQKKKKQ